jgi:hypothetical protein
VTCPGDLCLSNQQTIPVFICDLCGFQDNSWKLFYQDHLNIFKDKANWDIPKHRVSCVLGLFCYKYMEFFGVEYTFVPLSPNPWSAKEVKDANTLIAAFQKNMTEVRKYLVWVFKNIGSNTKMHSLAYVLSSGLIRKYMLSADRRNTYTRNSPLPDEFLEWCKTNTPEILSSYTLETMNDLGALLSYTNTYQDTNSIETKAIHKASELKLVINGSLNVGR